ncbi:hypothetical protein LEP1GSC132_4473 [Leptospira kirschneri str. 200803703]|nr:hypothetical protein LEP1GSC132_4473 [Leptospira kirschneri str. 200803703]
MPCGYLTSHKALIERKSKENYFSLIQSIYIKTKFKYQLFLF